jgi:hypothetical protein
MIASIKKYCKNCSAMAPVPKHIKSDPRNRPCLAWQRTYRLRKEFRGEKHEPSQRDETDTCCGTIISPCFLHTDPKAGETEIDSMRSLRNIPKLEYSQ